MSITTKCIQTTQLKPHIYDWKPTEEGDIASPLRGTKLFLNANKEQLQQACDRENMIERWHTYYPNPKPISELNLYF